VRFLAFGYFLQDDFSHTVDHAEVGETGGGDVLGEGKFGGEGAVDGEEGEGYGAGYVAAVGVDFCVEVFEGTGAVCCSELKHVVHSIDDLVEYKEYLTVDQCQTLERSFDARLSAAEREESFGCCDRGVGFGAGALEASEVSRGVDVDLFARFNAESDAPFHFIDLAQSR